MKPSLRPKSAQVFSHSLSDLRTLLAPFCVNHQGAGHYRVLYRTPGKGRKKNRQTAVLSELK
ncbi:TPA: hypothetical protein R6W42_001693 [Citrobacter freundii]|nr:hypothetical protein [Citrobacter freundii]